MGGSGRHAALAGLLALVLGLPSPAPAGGLPTVDAALAAAWPGATISRTTVFLSVEQRDEVARMAGTPPASRMVTRFRLHRDGTTVGWAYLDTHRVRTLAETLLVMLRPDGTVLRVEAVAFAEPREYLPPRGWYAQLEGRSLDGELRLKRGVRSITGATLSARAAVEATRRVLALHAVVEARGDTR